MLNAEEAERKTHSRPPSGLLQVTFNLPVSTVQMLKAYGKAYKNEYGEEPDEDYLVNEVIRDYLDSDKDFKRFLDENPEILEEIGDRGRGGGGRRGRKPKQNPPPEE